MDGAGRLAATLRPKADLKAAAIGAVILLRERLGFSRTRSTKGAAKAPARAVERKPPPRFVTQIERYLPQQVGGRLRQANRILHRTLDANRLAGGRNQIYCRDDGLRFIHRLQNLRSHGRRNAGININHICIGHTRPQLALQRASGV